MNLATMDHDTAVSVRRILRELARRQENLACEDASATPLVTDSHLGTCPSVRSGCSPH